MSETRCTCGEGHPTWGACIRAKNLRVSYCQSVIGHDRSRANKIERELDLYASARRQGIQPTGTGTQATRDALDISDQTGRAFNGDNLTKSLFGEVG